MYLAFRKTAAEGASWIDRQACALIQERLVSDFCHGGIVIDGTLYHVTAKGGLNKTTYNPKHWDLFRAPDTYKGQVLDLFSALEGKVKYDWFSLLAFAVHHSSIRDSKRLYCFEWMLYALYPEDAIPKGRITPELLLRSLHDLWESQCV